MNKHNDTLEHSHVDNSVAHTPGPWSTDGKVAKTYVVDGNNQIIADCDGIDAVVNAEFISNAPKMFELCRRSAEALHYYQAHLNDTPLLDELDILLGWEERI